MPSLHSKWRSLPREFFPYRKAYSTLFFMNDQYGHLNAPVYHLLQDSIINQYLIYKKVLTLPGSEFILSSSSSSLKEQACNDLSTLQNSIGICVENGFHYFAPVAFPQELELGLAVTHIGRTSVEYRCGIFVAREQSVELAVTSNDELKALGRFVHVFCDRLTMKPLPKMPVEVHRALDEIRVAMTS